MQSIIRTSDRSEYGLARRDIFGLNFFAANGVEVTAAGDPRIVFFRTLSALSVCSAHTGNLLDLADTPQELFGPPLGENGYVLARTGVYKGTFYDADEWTTFPACFFPQVKDGFWEAQTREGQSTIDETLDWDALALYVGANKEPLTHMQPLLRQPFPGHESWLRQVLSLYRLIVLTASASLYFHAYSNDASNFDLLTPATEKAVEAIRSHEWYQAHSAKLVWDDEFETGLELP
jgi:hypothetical protein